MSDRYLFKAKRVDNGEQIVGGLVKYGFVGKEKYYIIPDYASDLYAIEIDPNTICQCTGLTDKNGGSCMADECHQDTGHGSSKEETGLDFTIRENK